MFIPKVVSLKCIFVQENVINIVFFLINIVSTNFYYKFLLSNTKYITLPFFSRARPDRQEQHSAGREAVG